jgi:hypothetical protein
MQASRLLILLLLLAAVLVDLVMLSAVGSYGAGFFQWPHPILAVLFSLAFSQVSMAAIWAGSSYTSVPWRLAGLVGVVTLWSVALAWTAVGGVAGYGKDDWSVLLLGHAFFILWILTFVRAKGVRLAHCLKRSAEPEENRWQFSLGHLFAWLTATAIALGLLRYTIDFDSPTAGRHLDEIVLIGSCNAVVSLATLWAALSDRGLVWRVVVVCLAAGGVLSLPLLRGGGVDSSCFSWAVLWILQIVWLAAWLFVLRTAGIRFLRRNRGR